MLCYGYVSAIVLIISVASIATVFAVAVVAFLVLSIVRCRCRSGNCWSRTVLSSPSPHDGAGRPTRTRQRQHAAHLDVRLAPQTITPSFSVTVILLVIVFLAPPGLVGLLEHTIVQESRPPINATTTMTTMAPAWRRPPRCGSTVRAAALPSFRHQQERQQGRQ